jgi:hypothetical protein
MIRLSTAVLFVCLIAGSRANFADEIVRFTTQPDRLEITVGDAAIATYVFRDEKILRPYFAHVHAPGGLQVTRNHPPVAGVDASDHDTLHPGLWLAFGDLSGADFWRNKAKVEHVEFVSEPRASGDGGSFAVRNRYVCDGDTVCEEVCKVTISVRASGFWLVLDSRFSGGDDFYFGDQEEMGLGVRVATPLAVKNGGTLINSERRSGEKQVWGRPADWCDYSGTIDGKPIGVTLIPDPANFRRSWFHARDYGFVAANPFGQRAFTKGEKSRVVVRAGESLRLRFAVRVHAAAGDMSSAYNEALTLLAEQH